MVSGETARITILGSGTSQGVPVIACDCHVCKSTDPKDKRLRCSVLVSYKGKNYVIDSGPDFRQQMLIHDVQSLSGILFTHEHKDHLAGMDDIRAFNYQQKAPMKVYCTERVEKALRREFYYVFEKDKYPGVPSVDLVRIGKDDPFELENNLKVQPIEVLHYILPVLGFRFGNFTYITDAKTVSEEEKGKIKGTDVLVVNALRKQEHVSHFNLEQALEFIAEINPKRAYLTHISHLFDTHENISRMLPDNVFVAYDGLSFEIGI